MYSGEIVKKLLKETGKHPADLSELLYGNRKRSVSNLLGENANPTAQTLEKMAQFLGVPIDYFFVIDESQFDEDTPITEYQRSLLNLQKKYLRMQDERIQHLQHLLAMKEEEKAYKAEIEKQEERRRAEYEEIVRREEERHRQEFEAFKKQMEEEIKKHTRK